jgi:hypothetical protein
MCPMLRVVMYPLMTAEISCPLLTVVLCTC